MIDRYFQGKGYGKQALKLVMDEIRKRPTGNHIKLSIEPGNMSAQKIYESLGFKKTGELVEGEEVMRLDFDVED
jgi:diamine N-acetyltransferase